MFDPNSRYSKTPTDALTDPVGREIVYIRRRFLPRPDDLATLVELTVTQGDRLDLLTARAIGDPEQFWRACDASNAMNPSELTDQSGQTVRFPIPQPQ
ncbi:MAG: hypothetical protein ABIJ39_03775 [Chloroflexota bacterium]